jgi:hypothetical protein
LSEIVEKAREALGAHGQFKAWLTATSDAEIRAMMHWLGDERRLADLNIFFVHTPLSPEERSSA